jgi:outer membrane protein TolC
MVAVWEAEDSQEEVGEVEDEQREALQEQSIMAFQQAVLVGLQEVENALIASENKQDHHNSVTDTVSASQRIVELAVKLYTEGQTLCYMKLIDVKCSLLNVELSRVQTKGALFHSLRTYTSNGGGWVMEADYLTGITTDKISTHGYAVLHADQ